MVMLIEIILGDVRTVVFGYNRKGLDEFLCVIQLNLNKCIILIGRVIGSV